MKECFIITPIGNTGSDIRRETDGLVISVLEPVLEKFEFNPVPAHQISETGSITRQIIKRIIESELVIANLTELNPNVMYEVGIRHCARKPMIVLAKEGTILPFDLSDERTIFYRNDMIGTEELKSQLSEMIPKAINEEKPDNPIYRVVDIDLIKMSEEATDETTLLSRRFSLIEDQLDDIQSAIRKIMHSEVISNRGNVLSAYMSLTDFPSQSPFSVSCYIHFEDEKDLNLLRSFCVENGIVYDEVQVYKEEIKFTGFCKTKSQVSSLKHFIAELGFKSSFTETEK